MLVPHELDLIGECSDVIFITGLTNKAHSDDDIHQFLETSANVAGVYLEMERCPSKLWVRFASLANAVQSQAFFHQQNVNGSTIMCRFELGFCQETGVRMVSRKSIHTTVIRRIQNRKCNQHHSMSSSASSSSASNNTLPPTTATYSAKSLLLGETEYPFPSGLYLSRLVGLLQKWPRDDPLVELVSNTSPKSVINKYAKELSESMAMVDALERATKLCLGQSAASLTSRRRCHVRVYCVGDGKYPLTAAVMALSYPHANWEFVSIDPLLEPVDNHQHCLTQVSGMSQDYDILPPPPLHDDNDDANDDSLVVEIVVACHSHAPLQEFWDRILQSLLTEEVVEDPKKHQHRAIAITMACCSTYSDLDQTPILAFHDYEVYSPKRHIKIYKN